MAIAKLFTNAVDFTVVYRTSLLGSFVKLRKATICFLMSVRPTAWKNSAPNKRIFMKSYIEVYFENLSRKFKFH